MYKPYNLHKIMKYSRENQNNQTSTTIEPYQQNYNLIQMFLACIFK